MRYPLVVGLLTTSLLFGCAIAQTPPQNLKLEIQGISPSESGYDVKIAITNNGPRSVVLMLSAVKQPKLQSLNIQQWDGKAAWHSLGPYLHEYTEQTTTLKPNESLHDVVPIGDASFGGRIRPVICYFDSERAFRNRMRNKEACRLIEGPSFKAPPNPIVAITCGPVQAAILKQVRPTYPPEAKAKGIQGLVRIRATINQEGVLDHLEVVKGPKELVPASLEAVKKWRYKPLRLSGIAVKAETSIDINYVIPEKKATGK